MAALRVEPIGLIAALAVLAGCSGGGSKAATDAGVRGSGSTWSVTATYQPDSTPDPQVVFWTAQIEGEFYNPVLEAGVQKWSTTGTLTATRLPSRAATAYECSCTVSPDPQVITLDDSNTTVDLFLNENGNLLYQGMATTKILYQKTTTCPTPQPAEGTEEIGDLIPWLEIPQTAGTGTEVVIQGMGDVNAANRTWTLTKSGGGGG
jgi:hypothetical protein